MTRAWIAGRVVHLNEGVLESRLKDDHVTFCEHCSHIHSTWWYGDKPCTPLHHDADCPTGKALRTP